MAGYYLKSTNSQRLPKNVLYIDTETKVVSENDNIQWQAFNLGVTCYARRRYKSSTWIHNWHEWFDTDKLLDYLVSIASKQRCLYVIASNPVFDCWVTKFYTGMFDRGWKLKFLYDKGLTHIMKIVSGRRSIYVLAIQNFFPVGVQQLGEYLGFPKIECNPLKASRKELLPYCKRDVEILVKAFEEWVGFIVENKMGSFGLTRTSQAMKAYKHRFMEEPILVHNNTDIIEWERKAYMGARTECFQLGLFKDGPYVMLDVNSMYPFIMRNTDLPYKVNNVILSPSLQTLRQQLERFCCIAVVTLQTNDAAYAIKMNDRVCFPVGTFTTGLTTVGLKYALEHNHILFVHSLATYLKGNIFTSFVDTFYDLRKDYKQKENYIYDAICKYILNGFYGKWAQRLPEVIAEEETESNIFMRESIYDADTKTHGIRTSLMGKTWVESGQHESPNNMVAIAAHITEASRFLLWELINRLPRGGVLYCDTDSLLIHKKHLPVYQDVLSETELGKLGVERETPFVLIRGPKDYRLAGKNKIKGIRKDATYIGKGTFRQRMFPGVFTLLKEAKPGLFPVITRTKTLKRVYQKAIVIPTSTITRPFFLSPV